MEVRMGMNLIFNATFVGGMGSDKLILQATSLSFVEEIYRVPAEEEEDEKEAERQHILARLISSLKDALYFILEILFGYTTPKFYNYKL